MNTDMGQVWPVEHVDKPACGHGVDGHNHPAQDRYACVEAIAYGAPGMISAQRRPTDLQRGFVGAYFDRPLADQAAFHRAMCEPRYTSPRDIDKAFEIEADARRREQAFAARNRREPLPGAS